MAFPVAGTPVSTGFGTSATTMAVSLPSSITSGNLLLAIVETRNNATFTAGTPSGWTALSSQQGGGSAGYMRTFYRFTDGTEGSSATWTASIATTAVWQAIYITGTDGVTTPAVATANGDASNADPPNLAPSGGSKDYLWIACAGNTATGETTGFTAAPTNYSNLQSNGASSGGSTVNIATATRQLTASSENPDPFTPNSNRFWTAATIAIYPAAGSTNPIGYDVTDLNNTLGANVIAQSVMRGANF